MKYVLLTGATGLLGGYLLKDLLTAEVPVAVVVRRSRIESPRERIEGTLARHERQLGHALPRPVVFESDLCEENIGLDTDAQRWIAEHVDSVLHNAASLSFELDPETNEPYRSNIGGTQNVLALCKQTGIKQFHHVSTSYVCGLREGVVYEHERNVGQKFGNPYEESKLRAEEMVLAEDFLQQVTIYRPAIIVGDSQNGYTPTFHGFYAPLKVLAPFFDPELADPEVLNAFMEILGLKPDDRKSYVPVDWISSVMAYVFCNKQHHGNCYHLTPLHQVTAAETTNAIHYAFKKYSTSRQAKLPNVNFGELLASFQKQLEVYKSYWRCDPIFDASNTMAVAGHLPCPTLDHEMLMMLAGYAIRNNFGWPRPAPTRLTFDSRAFFESSPLVCQSDSRRTVDDADRSVVNFRLTGHGGGDWSIVHQGGSPIGYQKGVTDATTMIRLRADLFEMMLSEKSMPAVGQRGQIVVEGREEHRRESLALLENLLSCGGC